MLFLLIDISPPKQAPYLNCKLCSTVSNFAKILYTVVLRYVSKLASNNAKYQIQHLVSL